MKAKIALILVGAFAILIIGAGPVVAEVIEGGWGYEIQKEASGY